MDEVDFKSIESYFIENKDDVKVPQMEAYMKGRFKYLGIVSPRRKALLKEIFREYKWDRKRILQFAEHSWNSKYRELQYAGLDVLIKHWKKLWLEDIGFLEVLVTKHSWWDTVDGLAATPIGKTLKDHPEEKEKWVKKWMKSDDLWLRRTAILHQLKYKGEMDEALLIETINHANGTKEFFLNKAIGWILREYAKYNPEFVKGFCKRVELSGLSRREALKHF